MNNQHFKAEGRRSISLRLLLPVLMLAMAVFPAAADIVKGTVIDASGEPLIGATVIEKGTTNGTATDIDGFFQLNVNDAKKAVLVISYVGYATQEVPIKGLKEVNVTLQEESSLLNEVVVVGYGQQKKESVVGAISQVNSGDLLETPSATSHRLSPVRFRRDHVADLRCSGCRRRLNLHPWSCHIRRRCPAAYPRRRYRA